MADYVITHKSGRVMGIFSANNTHEAGIVARVMVKSWAKASEKIVKEDFILKETVTPFLKGIKPKTKK